MKIDAIWRPEVQQQIYRRLLDAYARPGTLEIVKELCGGHRAWIGLLSTLLDGQTSFADPHSLLDQDDWSLLQARRDVPENAMFVLCDGTRRPDFEPSLGTLESPEKGATLIIPVERLGEGEEMDLSGPGILGTRTLAVTGLDDAWIESRSNWVAAFPLGVDWVLADGDQFVALPRTTRINMALKVE